MGSVATRKYKDPPDRGVVCCDISLWVVWALENIKIPLIEVLYVVIEVVQCWIFLILSLYNNNDVTATK